METVFTRLSTLKLPFKILDVQVLLNLSLILLSFQLSHFFTVFILLPSEIILHVLVCFGRAFNLTGQLLFLVLKFIVPVRIINLLLDGSLKCCKCEICFHLFGDGKDCLDQVIFVLSHLLLIRLYSRFFLQLSTEFLRAILKLRSDALIK